MKKYRKASKPINFFDDNINSTFFTHTISQGDEYSYHSHNFYEIVYIQSGEIIHFVNNKSQKLRYGNVVFLRPKDEHVYIRENKECSHRDLIFEQNFFEEVCNFINPNLLTNYLSHKQPVNISLTSQQLNDFENAILKIDQQINDKSDKNTLIKIFLIELLSVFYNNTLLTKNDALYPNIINQILEKINLSFKEPLCDILSIFQYDKAYLSRLFKSRVGLTMTSYLTSVRLDYVTTQLKLTNKTIADISYDAGFNSVSHLNKIFKAKFGVTPSQFKKTKTLQRSK